jgi:hypothetical protein
MEKNGSHNNIHTFPKTFEDMKKVGCKKTIMNRRLEMPGKQVI